jgi:hypothetical protein
MKDRKIKKVAEEEIQEIKSESTLNEDCFFEFLNTKFNKEMQSFWKLIELENQ